MLRSPRLPVVRAAPRPATGAVPEWLEGPDWIAAVAAVAVAGLGLVLAIAAASVELGGASPRPLVVIGALLAGSLAVAVLVMVLGEVRYRLHIRVEGRELQVRQRTLGGERGWREPLAAYTGLAVCERTRRFYLRNQGRPPTGRRGPVSEFVIVLVHGSDRGRDLELYRAQPSMETLRAMHGMSTARQGEARARVAQRLEELARGYREVLASLARRLRLPVLIHTPDGWQPTDVARLGLWLEASSGA